MSTFDGLDKALRWLRLQHRRKQCEVAQAAGITQAMLCSYEQGKRQPSLRTLGKILAALGADLPDLFRVLEAVRQGPVAKEETGIPRGSASRCPPPADGITAVKPVKPSVRPGLPPLVPLQSDPLPPPVAAFDLQQWLDISHRLPAEQEMALSQMVQGFRTWMRLLHATATTQQASLSEE